MKKKIVTFILGALLFALCSSIEAQQPAKVPRIGYVAPLSPASESARIEPFRQGLRDLKYIEGQIFWLIFATRRESQTAFRNSWPNSCSSR